MGLRLSAVKSRVCHIDEGFGFLGWRIQRRAWRSRTGKRAICTHPSKKTLASIIDKVRTLTRRAKHKTLAELLRRLNPALRGRGSRVKRMAEVGAVEVGDRLVSETAVDLHGLVPGQRLARADGVVLDSVGFGVPGQGQPVGDLSRYSLQRFEAAFPDLVLPGGVDPGPHVGEVGSGGDERREAGGAERAAVVRHDGHRRDLTGLRVGDQRQQRSAGQPLRLADRRPDRGDRVELVRGQRQMPTPLVFDQ